MAISVEWRGADDAFRELARRLDVAGGRGVIINAVGHAIEDSAPELEAAAIEGAQRLPKGGGLDARVSQTRITRRTRRGGGSFSLRLVAPPNAVKDPAAINRGRVRHPTYGRAPYVIQIVPAGWFTEPIKAFRPVLRERVAEAMREALKEI